MKKSPPISSAAWRSQPVRRESGPSTSRGDWSWCSWPSITSASMQAFPRADRAVDLLHAVGDALLCTRLRLLRWCVGVSATLHAHRHRRALALSSVARPADRADRAHGDALRVDLQLRRDGLQHRRRAVDDRLEHGRPRGSRVAAVQRDRHARPPDRLRPQPRRSVSARHRRRDRRKPIQVDLAVPLLRWLGHAWRVRTAHRDPVHADAVDRRDGRRLRVRTHPATADRAAQPRVPGNRRRGDRAVHRAEDVQHLWRSAAVERRATALVPQHGEVSRVAVVPVDDARPA